MDALWAPFESQQTSVDAPCPTERGEGNESQGGARCCVHSNSLTQLVDVINVYKCINVMNLWTEWQARYTPMMFCESLVLLPLSPNPDICFQDPTVLVPWHFLLQTLGIEG